MAEPIQVNLDKCTGCGICAKSCPFGAISVVDKKARISEACVLCSACVQACPVGAITIERREAKADLSAFKDVWVFAEVGEGCIKGVSFELLGKAGELARELNQRVCAVLLGQGVRRFVDELAEHGADVVYMADSEALSRYTTDAYSSVVAGLVARHRPNILLFPATKQGRDLAPRVAATIGLGLTADCTGLSIRDGMLLQTRPAFGGNIMADILCPYTRPQMATVRPNVMPKPEPVRGRKAEVVEVPVSLDPRSVRVHLRERVSTCATGEKRIEEADVIVAGGRGACEANGFELLQALADELNGVVGASRVAIDLGKKPKSVQVGQSGITVSPKLYIVCGVSGAIQHTVGMRGSKLIVAVNTDPAAPIFEFSQYGIVGDLFQVVPALVEEIRRRRACR
ncbi:MAG: FAD-binding protein [Thermoplasmatota archaeon]